MRSKRVRVFVFLPTTTRVSRSSHDERRTPRAHAIPAAKPGFGARERRACAVVSEARAPNALRRESTPCGPAREQANARSECVRVGGGHYREEAPIAPPAHSSAAFAARSTRRRFAAAISDARVEVRVRELRQFPPDDSFARRGRNRRRSSCDVAFNAHASGDGASSAPRVARRGNENAPAPPTGSRLLTVSSGPALRPGYPRVVRSRMGERERAPQHPRSTSANASLPSCGRLFSTGARPTHEPDRARSVRCARMQRPRAGASLPHRACQRRRPLCPRDFGLRHALGGAGHRAHRTRGRCTASLAGRGPAEWQPEAGTTAGAPRGSERARHSIVSGQGCAGVFEMTRM